MARRYNYVKRTVRIPMSLNIEMDDYVNKTYCPNINQFIIEAINEKLKKRSL